MPLKLATKFNTNKACFSGKGNNKQSWHKNVVHLRNPNGKSAVSRSLIVFRQEMANNRCQSPAFQTVFLLRCQRTGIGVSGCAIGITSFITILRWASKFTDSCAGIPVFSTPHWALSVLSSTSVCGYGFRAWPVKNSACPIGSNSRRHI